jgi:hypothetical protein
MRPSCVPALSHIQWFGLRDGRVQGLRINDVVLFVVGAIVEGVGSFLSL